MYFFCHRFVDQSRGGSKWSTRNASLLSRSKFFHFHVFFGKYFAKMIGWRIPLGSWYSLGNTGSVTVICWDWNSMLTMLLFKVPVIISCCLLTFLISIIFWPPFFLFDFKQSEDWTEPGRCMKKLFWTRIWPAVCLNLHQKRCTSSTASADGPCSITLL